MKTPTIEKLCNNKATIVTVPSLNGSIEYFFSYTTCVAIRGDKNGVYVKARLINSWGPTTGKHINQMGCGDFDIVSDEDFQTLCQ